MLPPLRCLVPDPIRRRYALKFMIVLLVIGLSIGALGYFGTERLAAEVEQQAHADQGEFAQQEARHVANWHDRNHYITRVLSTSNVVVADEVDDAYFSRTSMQYAGTVNHLHYVDVGDREVRHSTSSEIPRSFDDIDEPWTAIRPLDELDGVTHLEFARTQSFGTYVSHDGTPVAAYAKPIPNERGQYRNSERFLVVTAELESLSKEMIDGDGRISYVVDSSTDRVLVDPSGASYFEGYGHDDVIDGENGSVEFGRPGETLRASIETSNPGTDYADGSYIASYAQLPGSDVDHLYVVVHTPTEEAFGLIRSVHTFGSRLSITGIVLVVLAGGVMGHRTAQSISQLRAKTERMETGDLDVELETHRIDDLGRLYDGLASMRDALREQIDEARAAHEAAEAERAQVQRLNDELQRHANEYADVMQAAADGDMTVRIDSNETDNESMSKIAEEFNEMLTTIEVTIARLNRFASEVADASERVSNTSEEVHSAGEQVADSIQEISVGAQQQNESLQAVTREMADLSASTDEISASSDEVANIAAQTADTGHRGQEAAREAIDGMNQIETGSTQAVEEIDRLESEVLQIDELIEQIQKIADQTNMLALDATIEASRSQTADVEEHDGFDFVTRKVKELSQDTKEVTEEIESRLERIREQTGRSATEVERTSEMIDDVGDSVEDAVDALEEIAVFARETNAGIQEISDATEQQAESTHEVVTKVENAASISQDATAEARVVAAVADKQATELTQVSTASSKLSSHARRLSQALDRFETDVDDPLLVPPTLVESPEIDREETGPTGVGDGSEASESSGQSDDTPIDGPRS